MKLNTGKYKYKELIKWYKKPNAQTCKRILNNQLPEIKEFIGGRHALFIGLSDFKKKFDQADSNRLEPEYKIRESPTVFNLKYYRRTLIKLKNNNNSNE